MEADRIEALARAGRRRPIYVPEPGHAVDLGRAAGMGIIDVAMKRHDPRLDPDMNAVERHGGIVGEVVVAALGEHLVLGLHAPRQFDEKVVDHGPDAGHPPGSNLGLALLGIARHVAGEGDDAIAHRHADVAAIDGGFEVECLEDKLLEVVVGVHGHSLLCCRK